MAYSFHMTCFLNYIGQLALKERDHLEFLVKHHDVLYAFRLQDSQGFYGVQRQIYLYLRDSQKIIFCHYILSEGIFHTFCLFYYFLCNYGTSKSKDNNWTET